MQEFSQKLIYEVTLSVYSLKSLVAYLNTPQSLESSSAVLLQPQVFQILIFVHWDEINRGSIQMTQP